MSYLTYFGLVAAPYDKNSSGNYNFISKSANECLARLNMLECCGGIFHLYGQYGTGKSSILNLWAKNQHNTRDICYINFVTMRPAALLYQIAKEFGLTLPTSKIKLYNQLRNFFSSVTKKPIIIIDDACKMTTETIFDLRLLTADSFDEQACFLLILSSGMQMIHSLVIVGDGINSIPNPSCLIIFCLLTVLKLLCT